MHALKSSPESKPVPAAYPPLMDSTLQRGVLEDVAIRLAVADDAAMLAELAIRTFREAYAADTLPADMDSHLARWYGPAIQRAEIADAAVRTLLVMHAGQAIGFTQLRLHDARNAEPACVINPPPPAKPLEHPMEVWRFYIDRPWQGRGVAQRLMDAVIELAQSLGARSVWLGVWERNPRAIVFYKKCGYQRIGEHHFRFADELHTDLVMAKRV